MCPGGHARRGEGIAGARREEVDEEAKKRGTRPVRYLGWASGMSARRAGSPEYTRRDQRGFGGPALQQETGTVLGAFAVVESVAFASGTFGAESHFSGGS